MKTLSLALALCFLPLSAQADTPQTKAAEESVPVTISAKGEEVRSVLTSLFEQEKKQYVIDANTHYSVYLSLDKADFHRTLDIVCNLAGLQADLRDGIYFVHLATKPLPKPETPAPAPPAQTKTAQPTPARVQTADHPAIVLQPVVQHPVVPKPAPVKPAPQKTEPEQLKPIETGPIPAFILQKHVNTRLTKAPIRDLFAELSRQTGVKIVVDDKVPAFKLDAYLLNTSLRYSLDRITRAAGLHWSLPQDHTVLITLNTTTTPKHT